MEKKLVRKSGFDRSRLHCRELFILFLMLLLTGCEEIRSYYSDPEVPLRNVQIYCDNMRYEGKAPSNYTIADVLNTIGITVNKADIVEKTDVNADNVQDNAEPDDKNDTQTGGDEA